MLVAGPDLSPPPPPNLSFATFSQMRRELSTSGNNLAVPYRTASGPGGKAPSAFTPEVADAKYKAFSDGGYGATRLAPAQFQSGYGGKLLSSGYGLLRPTFGSQRVDYRV